MEYRTLGRTGLQVGVVGLGVEHLEVSRENMDEVFDLAVSAGLNYVDLVYNDPMDDHAAHWQAIAPALQRHRSSLILALHWGFIYHEPQDRCQRCFDKALDLVGDGCVDIGFVGIIDTESLWQGWAQEAIGRMKQRQRDGKIGHIGLAGHNVEVARMAVESDLIDVLMFPVNLYQHPRDPDRAALMETCVERGVGVVAMKPFYGGRLLSGITPVQCLNYTLSQPVATAVPGAHNADEMRQALRYGDATDEEKRYTALGDDLASELQGQCVHCKHCMPCPEDIRIPLVIQSLDYVETYSGTEMSAAHNRLMYSRSPAPASACTECGVCEQRCPFGVDIIGKMRRAAEVFEIAG